MNHTLASLTLSLLAVAGMVMALPAQASTQPDRGPPDGSVCIGDYNPHALANACSFVCPPGECALVGISCIYPVGDVCVPVWPVIIVNSGCAQPQPFPDCSTPPSLYIEAACDVSSGHPCGCWDGLAKGVVYAIVCTPFFRPGFGYGP